LNGKYLLKKNNLVEMPAHVLHSDPSLWGPTFAEFDPLRFLPQNRKSTKEHKKHHPEAFRPFGGGKNLCPGRHFAATEVLALVVMMAMRYDLRPTTALENWTRPESHKSSIAAVVREPDTDIDVEVTLRKGFEHGNWAFRLEDSELIFATIAEDQAS